MMTKLFNLEAYYSRLKTASLGRPCVYLDKTTSTIDVAGKESPNCLVLAKEQTDGRGQRNNQWTSPEGCAMGTLRLSLDKAAFLSRKLCFLQHIMALTIAWSLERLNTNLLGKDRVRLKWPNDIIYANSDKSPLPIKLGGVLVTANDQNDKYDVLLSFGVNVFNKEPTTCVSEILDNPNDLSMHTLVADIINDLEQHTIELDDSRFERLKSDYKERCIHLNKKVTDETHGLVAVDGIDDDGYLVGARVDDQQRCTVTKIVSYDQ